MGTFSAAELADHEFDVAVSFAGQDRALVLDVVRHLQAAHLRVFYDNDHQAELLGEDLVELLREIYLRRSRFAVLFVSRHYVAGEWTTFERRAVQERAFHQLSAYLLPIRLDDTELPGLPDTTGYLDATKLDARAIARIVATKAALPRPADRNEVDRLVAERPFAWEYLLYAAELRRAFERLEPAYRDHALSYAPRSPDHLDDAAALRYIRTATTDLTRVVATVDRLFSATAQRAAFGGPGEPGDPDRITHLAHRLAGVYEELLTWAADLRSTTIEHPVLRRLADAAARLTDRPIETLRSFVVDCVRETARLADGESPTVDLTISLTVSDDCVSVFLALLTELPAHGGPGG